ncbi:prepilin peptidase [Candidatus Gracilibacteria bacterium]|nr:MAG: prepilin peptidase [Candidatus Gracilibacteria bacterium]
MQNLFYLFLFTFGAIFGSFASVLIYRLKSGEKGIFFGRSHCKDCQKELGAFELIPIVSWLKNFGKCKYCKKDVSAIYPILEISTGLVFTGVGAFLINFENIFAFDYLEIAKLFFWLTISFVTIIYIFYDILFTEIHEGIMIFGIGIAFLGIFLNYFFEINNILPSGIGSQNIEIISSLILGITILGGLYIIMLKELKEIYDLLILILIGISIFVFKNIFPEINILENPVLNGVIGALWIFIFFFLQIVLSGGKALGGGDLRIGIMIGLLLGVKFSIISIVLTYFIGSLIGIFILIKNYNSEKQNIVPFGPFLGVGFFLTLFFSQSLLLFIRNYFSFM